MSTDIEKETAKEWRAERDKKSPLTVINGGAPATSIPSRRKHTFTAADLQHQEFPPVQYCVPDLIPEGLTLLAGKPKIGKSWLALDICIAVASGRYCLGERKPDTGDVLYAALEDNKRRLQRRVDRLLSPVSARMAAAVDAN